jgi:catechol 2,3-dioxygenase-like lactoylglutathione lyase family enzyme
MPLAAYTDLCIDAVDAPVATRFWAEVLGLDPHLQADGDGELRDQDGHVIVRVNGVAESKTVKNRVHIDISAESVRQVIDAGATVVEELPRWTVLADPDGQEFCVFVRDEPITQRLYELAWDCPQGPEPSHAQAAWWQAVVGGVVVDDERGFSWLEQIPDAPFFSMDFVGVPEPKTVKNRVHIDVTTDDVDALLSHGATLLQPRGGELGWDVLADPDGNEFCAFTS